MHSRYLFFCMTHMIIILTRTGHSLTLLKKYGSIKILELRYLEDRLLIFVYYIVYYFRGFLYQKLLSFKQWIYGVWTYLIGTVDLRKQISVEILDVPYWNLVSFKIVNPSHVTFALAIWRNLTFVGI